ncbi:MAG: sugar transferase [Planctomycetota bacterium]|jgi:exopolysaccharide biosynthesis polyprenyl glycosylphosphotransferase
MASDWLKALYRLDSISKAKLSQAFPRPLRISLIPLRFSERKLLLGAMDLLVLNAALFLRLAYEGRSSLTLGAAWDALPWFVVLSALWLVVALFLNLYDLARAASAMHSLWATGGAALLTSGAYLLIPRLTPGLPPRRLALFLFPALATAGVALWRVAYAKILTQPTFHHSALVVGAGWAGHTLIQAISEQGGAPGNPYHGTGYQVLGLIDDDPAKQGQEVAGVRVIGTRSDLVRLAKLLQPDELVVAITDTDCIHPDLFQAILDCCEMGIPVTTMADLYERMTGRVPVEHAGRNLHVVLPVCRPAAHRIYLVLWRALEILIALAGCTFMLLVSPLVWLADRVASPGALFYRQSRVGKGGKVFRVIKFRSMVMDAEKHSGAVWARKDDERITPLGRFLRKTRLDEVPQFWNVLKGEMSLIGPRPERPEFVAQLAEQIPFYCVRHAVKPGLTGWAQVMYRYGSTVEDALIKLQHDLYYIKHQGPYLDLLILIRTCRTVLRMEGH